MSREIRTWTGAPPGENSDPRGSLAAALVRGREALSGVLGVLGFVEDGDGEVLHRDVAAAVLGDQQPVAAQPVAPRALAWREQGARADERPLQGRVAAGSPEHLQRLRGREGLRL